MAALVGGSPVIARTEPACLLIADIAGYSGYLAGVELDHAQDILGDLIDTVVRALRPTLRLAKLEGDAAFVWVPTESVDGPALLDLVEGCYFAFQRRIRDIQRASTCECNACSRMPGLGLKFVAHHGAVARQRMAGREELVGTDVVVVHRLLKNRVGETLGLPAYAFYTDALVATMGVEDPAASGMLGYRERFDSVGEVTGWVVDLAAAWQQEQGRVRTKVTDEQSLPTVTVTAAVPRPILWEWVTSPARRVRWTSGVTGIDEDLARSRRGVGAVNHCAHGKDVTLEEIVDWVPPEYVTKRIDSQMPGVPRLLVTMELIAQGPDETELVMRMARPRSRKDQEMVEMIWSQVSAGLPRDLQALVELAVADAAQRAAVGGEEPVLPAPTARHLSVPGPAPAPTHPVSDPSDAGDPGQP